MDAPDTQLTDPKADADLQAVLDRVMTGKSLDPEIARRIQERAECIRQEILSKHGIINVAVDLIHEGRNEE